MVREPVASWVKNQLSVWPSLALESVGAVVTFAVSVVVNTFDASQFKLIAVALKITALAGV
jgi:hypothetical protein